MPAASTRVAELAPATVTVPSVPSVRVPPSLLTWICDSYLSLLSLSAPAKVIRPPVAVVVFERLFAAVTPAVKPTLPGWSALSLTTSTLSGLLAKYSRV